MVCQSLKHSYPSTQSGQVLVLENHITETLDSLHHHWQGGRGRMDGWMEEGKEGGEGERGEEEGREGGREGRE